MKDTIQAGTIIVKGIQGKLNRSDLFDASEEALTQSLGIDIPDTAKYILNEVILPRILAGPPSK